MIVDFRCRPPTPEFLDYFPQSMVVNMAKRNKVSVSQAFLNASLDEFFVEMKEAGVDYAVAVGRNSPALMDAGTVRFNAASVPNQHIVDLQRKYPEHIIGMAGIDVSNKIHNAIDEIETYVEKGGLKGVFIEPQRAFPGQPDDKRIYPVYEKCVEINVPVVIMTGALAGDDIGYADPTPIDHVAAQFPDLKIVCGHGSWPDVTRMIAVALKHPNVYISPDTYQFRPGSLLYVEAANGFLEDQYLFGTAYPMRALKPFVEEFKKLPFTPEAMDKALGGNARRLLGL